MVISPKLLNVSTESQGRTSELKSFECLWNEKNKKSGSSFTKSCGQVLDPFLQNVVRTTQNYQLLCLWWCSFAVPVVFVFFLHLFLTTLVHFCICSLLHLCLTAFVPYCTCSLLHSFLTALIPYCTCSFLQLFLTAIVPYCNCSLLQLFLTALVPYCTCSYWLNRYDTSL